MPNLRTKFPTVPINAVLAAAGYNFGLLLRWLAGLLRALFQAFAAPSPSVRLV